MDDLDQVLETLDAIAEHLKRNDLPKINGSALSQLSFLTAQISGFDYYISEKAARIASLGGVFYSETAHRQHPGGAEALWVEMSYDLPNRIRQQVSHLQRLDAQRAANAE